MWKHQKFKQIFNAIINGAQNKWNLKFQMQKHLHKYTLVSGHFTILNNGNLGTYYQV